MDSVERAKLEAWITGEATKDTAAYAVTEENIRGTILPVYKYGPKTLRDVYASGQKHAHSDFLVYEGERYTYGDAWLRAAALANRLIEKGIKKGDRVAIAMRNYPEFAFAYMGVTSMGAIAVPLNGWWTGPELVYGLEDSGSKLAIVDGERLERLLPLRDTIAQVGLVCCRANGPLPAGVEDFSAWTAGDASTQMPEVSLAPEDDANIAYTSGSTGKPKGAVLTHRGITTALMSWGAHWLQSSFPDMDEGFRAIVVGWLSLGAQAHDVSFLDLPLPEPLPQASMLVNLPLFHVTGLYVMLLASYSQGRKIVLMRKWNAEAALELIEREKISQLHGVPTMTWELMQSPDLHKRDISSLTSVGGGGAARPAEHVRQMSAKLPNTAPSMGYGMTETSALGASIGGQNYLDRPASVGRAIPAVTRIDIVDDNGNLLPTGSEGEIRIFSPANMRGYWNKPEETKKALRDGCVYTGDVGKLDSEGYLYITDRKKDIVIRGGENISCAEVESAIYEHPAAYEAAVYGLPDERLGEILAATITIKAGHDLKEDEIIARLKQRLAGFKVPERVRLIREQLPRIASGKIDKQRLRREHG